MPWTRAKYPEKEAERQAALAWWRQKGPLKAAGTGHNPPVFFKVTVCLWTFTFASFVFLKPLNQRKHSLFNGGVNYLKKTSHKCAHERRGFTSKHGSKTFLRETTSWKLDLWTLSVATEKAAECSGQTQNCNF